MAARYEYRVVQVREGLVGGRVSADKVERLMNQHAREGWQVRAVTVADVKGRLGPGGTEGLLVTFERPL